MASCVFCVSVNKNGLDIWRSSEFVRKLERLVLVGLDFRASLYQKLNVVCMMLIWRL